MNIGQRIRERREAAGYTLNGFADLAGISKATLHDIENKENVRISADVLYKIAKNLNVTMECLLGKPNLADHRNLDEAAMARTTALINEVLDSRERLAKISQIVAKGA